MEKCPKCGCWTLDLCPNREKATCLTCGYVTKITAKQYREINDLTPKLIKAVELRSRTR
ncbi:MAG: hypothetical protein ACBZ72_12330 [Candidatus Bathyarchaeia archaeon]|jgi:transcription initiation factor TFIIIB Brf1 subunit/transcription initiation factor TFIIB